MKKIKLLLSLLIAQFVFTACPSMEEQVIPELRLMTSSMEMDDPKSASVDLEFIAIHPWTAEVTDGSDWMKVSPTSGSGADSCQVVIITVKENKDSDVRTGTVAISMDGVESKTLTLTQPAAEGEFELSDSELTFDAAGGEKMVTIYAPDPWTVEMKSSLKDWIEVSPEKGRATDTGREVTISVKPNEGEERKGVISFVLGDDSETIDLKIVQKNKEEEKEDVTPSLILSQEEVTLEAAGGDVIVEVTATCDWTVTFDETADWLVVDPASGTASADAQQVTVSALSNEGYDREVSVEFSIGMQTKYLTVKQAGPKGSADALVIYSNDYDKEVAQKTYGSGTSWPYLDQFEGWKNQKGTGAANVTYAFSGMSARSNSTSDSSYSDYPGSGNNNMFFGKSAYLATHGIALGEAKDLELTFGTEKYSQDNGSLFKNEEFHIWLSADGGAKWVELTDYTFAGGTTEGRWNVATANFSVPAGTAALSICMAVDVASSYRMDDFKLVASAKEGTAVDFSKAVAKDFGAGSTGGGNGAAPESKGKKTVAEFIAAADNANYYELTGTVSGFNSKYCSFDLTDATGKIYVYSVLDSSKSQWSSKISNGGTITIYGKYLYYEKDKKHEAVDAYIVSYTSGEGGGTSDGGNTGGGNTGGDTNGDNTGDGTGGNTGTAEDFESGTYSYTFEKGVIKGAGNLVLNKLAWNLDATDFTYVGFDATKGLQIGSSNNPALNITLKTESIKGTIKSVKVNTSGAKDTDATLSVTVGGSAFGQAATLTNTATDHTFEGSATGALELVWNLTKKAVYVKSIEVVVE